MGNFFFGLYRFFSRRRLLLWLLFFMITGTAVFLTTRLRMDEQISRKTTRGNASGRMQEMAVNTGLTDNLIIRISMADTTAVPEIPVMTAFATELADTLLKTLDSTYIGSITPNPQDTSFLWFSSFLTDHLPVYLDEQDYRQIGQLTSPASIRQAMENNFRILTTPAGMVMRERILKDPLGLSGIALNKLKFLQGGDQYLLIDGFVFTGDEKNLLLFITSANPAGETAKNGRMLDIIGEQISHLKTKYPAVEAESWGGIAMAVGNAVQLKKDITLTLSLAILFIFLVLAWYFRSFWIPLAGFIPAVFGGVVALAVFYLVKGTISAIALGIGAVLLGLIVDYALYIVNRYRKTGSVETVLRDMSQTVIVCALTSIGAFLCLLFLDSGVLFDLGLFAALSLAGAAVFALIFLPHLLSFKILKFRNFDILNPVDRIAAIGFERKNWLIGLILVAGIISLFFIGKVKFEEDMNALNFVTPELKAAGDRLERISEINLKSVYVVAEGRDLDEALFISEKAQAPVQLLEKSGTVRSHSGIQDLLLPQAKENERLERWSAFWTQAKRDSVKREIAMAARSLGMKAEAFTPFLSLTEAPGEGPSDSLKKVVAEKVLKNWVRINENGVYVTTILKVPEMHRQKVYKDLQGLGGITVFDKQEMTKQFVESVRSDFGRLVTLTMIFVTALLIFSFGRIEIGLTTAIPMFFSWLLTLGFMGITGIRFNIFNIIISSFIFGLGVDYSILMMRGLLHKYKYGNDEMPNYKVSVFLSSATTVIGVGVLLFARHPALHSIAGVAVFGVVSVVVVSWTLVPLLVKWMLFDRKAKGGFPVFARAFVHAIFIAWIPITSIAIILVIYATLISPILPVKKKKKQQLFHRLFSSLSRAYIATNFPKYHKIENKANEDFSRPAIIIVNHQSLIETPAMLRMHPNILIMANNWVFTNWVFGPVARVAGFIPISQGIEGTLDIMRQRMAEGYSILIFPEGSRSPDGHIQRFHRGAFYAAEKLQADILPVLMFGSGDFLKKTEFWGKPNRLFMKIMPRIKPDDPRFGNTYQERARSIRQYYLKEYAQYRLEHATPAYYSRIVIQNYIFKGPVLEWYVRIKMMLEDNFTLYHEHLPLKGNILDLGCGYGYMVYMLAFTSEERKITGIDHDPDKIAVARNCHSRNTRTEFICADVAEYKFSPQEGIILGDVLHYLAPDQQESLLRRCMENLAEGGVLLVREGFRDSTGQHQRTRMTEFFSTRIMGFNKTPDPSKALHFLSETTIEKIAEQHGMKVDVLTEKRTTSNKLIKIMKSRT